MGGRRDAGPPSFCADGVEGASGNFSISGGAARSLVTQTGILRVTGVTVTLTGTPAFSTAFASANLMGFLFAANITFSGSGTGKRYDSVNNSVVYTNGAGASYFPGNATGTTSNGGQYV